MTYGQFKQRMREILWPFPGEPENLRAAHDQFFNLAMVEIAKWCRLNRLNNTSVIPACATNVRCGLTYVDAPVGIIRRVKTIANGEWCDFVCYDAAKFNDVMCMSREMLCGWVDPENSGLPALQQGFKYAESSTDSTWGRARTGMWSVERRRLVIYPWIQSNESVVVEWDGWKTQWNDADQIDEEIWGPDVESAIRTFVRWKHEEAFGCDSVKTREAREAFYGDGRDHDGELANLIYWDKKKREGEAEECCPDVYVPTQAEIDDDVVPGPLENFVFAVVGNYGKLGDPFEDVANMVKGWVPAFIVSAGNNLIGANSYANIVGPKFGAFVTTDPLTTKFFPAIGTTDYQSDTLTAYDAYFGPIGRYYDVVKGDVHFFVLNTDPREADGNSVISVQAQWLQAALAASGAKYKVVMAFTAPYTDGDNQPGSVSMRWPFADWGADVVISGSTGAYERFTFDIPHLVTGWGGNTLETLQSTVAGFAAHYAGEYGALKFTVNAESMTIQAITRTGLIVDTVTITP